MEWFQRVQLRRLDEHRWKWRITDANGQTARIRCEGEFTLDEQGRPSPAADVPITVLCALAHGLREGAVDEIDHRTDTRPPGDTPSPVVRQRKVHRIDREPWGPRTLREQAEARAAGTS